MVAPSKTNVLEGPVHRHILRMLGPFSIAVIALISTGIVDTIYLGRLTDPDNPNIARAVLAALGIAFPLSFLVNSANIGLGAGTMSAVSRALGQGDVAKSRRHAAAAILLGLFVMTIFVSIMLLNAPFVLSLMGQSQDIQTRAFGYLLIVMPGLVLVSVASMSNNILRAGGEALLPSSIMILGALINIFLNPFFIYGWGPFPRMELQGAALSTLVGNGVGAAYGFYIVLFHRKAVDFVGMTFQSMKHAWSIIGQVGLPAAGTNIIVPLATWIVVAIIGNVLGEADVAAFTVASRAELISVGLLYALSACIGAVTGRNGGAGKTDRVRAAFRVSYLICVIWGTLMALLLAIFAREIAHIFTSDDLLIDKIVPYFYIVPVTVFCYGFVFVSAAGLNALGRPLYGLTYTIIRSLVLYVGLVGTGVYFAGLTGAYIGVAAANIVSGLIAFIWTMKKAPMTAKES